MKRQAHWRRTNPLWRAAVEALEGRRLLSGTVAAPADDPAVTTVSVGPSDNSVPGTVSFPIALSPAPAAPVTLHYTIITGPDPDDAKVQDFDATQNAEQGVDLPIGAGVASTSLNLAIVGDTSDDKEDFTVQFTVVDGDAQFSTGASPVLRTASIPAPPATSVALSANAASVLVGDDVTYTATVLGADGVTPVTSGTVRFADGTGTSDVVTLGPTGQATFTDRFATAGTPAVTASYVPANTALDAPSVATSSAVTVTAPVLTVGTGDGSTLGQVRFPIVLSGPASHGAIRLGYQVVAGTGANGAPLGDLANSSGTITIPADTAPAPLVLTVASNTRQADESFSVQFTVMAGTATLAAGSDSVGGTIDAPLATTVTLAPTSSMVDEDEADVCVATVTAGGVPVTTGRVTFGGDGGTQSGSVASDGTATFTPSFIGVGTKSVTAAYVGDGVRYRSSDTATTHIAVGSLSSVVTGTTLATYPAGNPGKGNANVVITNDIGAAVKQPVTIRIYAVPSDGSNPAGTWVSGAKFARVGAGSTTNVAVPLVAAKLRSLASGGYLLVSSVVSGGKTYASIATAGFTVEAATVSYVVTLAKPIAFPTGSTGGDTKLSAVLSVTNTGNTDFEGVLSPTITATPTVGQALTLPVQPQSVAIRAGRSITFTVPLVQLPTVTTDPPVTYVLVGRVGDARGNVSSYVSLGSVTVSKPTFALRPLAVKVVGARARAGEGATITVAFENAGNVPQSGVHIRATAVSVVVSLVDGNLNELPVATVPVRYSADFKPGATTVVTLRVRIPQSTPAGAYRFRAMLNSADDSPIIDAIDAVESTTTTAVSN